MMQGIEFANPQFLYLFLLIPVMGLIHWKIRTKRRTDVRVPDLSAFSNYRPSWRQRLGWLPVFLRFLAVAAIIVALARPRSSSSGSNVTSEGISIVLAMDVSTSMLAEDLRPNRIEAENV